MRNRILSIIILSLAVILTGCRQNASKGSSVSDNVPAPEPTPEPDYGVGFNNQDSFFRFLGDREITYVEANSEYAFNIVSTYADFTTDVHDAIISIKKDSDGNLVPEFSYKGKAFNLSDLAGIPAGDLDMTAVAALDLNGDGDKELLLDTGSAFCIHVFSVGKGRESLKHAGMMDCNSGFFLTDDNRIVSMFGSQGTATIYRYQNGKIITLDDEGLDRLLMDSKEYHNLRYEFDDTSEQDRGFTPIFLTDRYIICHHDNIVGFHVMKVDLDGDGINEELFIGNQGWGAQYVDMVRVNAVTTSYSITAVMNDADDTVALENNEFDSRVKDYMQLSALDIDNDGRLEVIASAGTVENNSNYVFSYNNGLTLLRHFFGKGQLSEESLKSQLTED